MGATIESIANELNPVIRGWIQYYSKFNRDELRRTMLQLADYLIRWCLGKYPRLRCGRIRGINWLRAVRQ
ncbi:MAG: group II intron maturase-specific domain-containing protein [Oligoflexales bacterium]